MKHAFPLSPLPEGSIGREGLFVIIPHFQKRNSRATDDVELGVIVPEGASEEKGTDVECKNEPRGCHSNVTSEGSAQERLRHVDSEDEPGGRGGEVRGASFQVINSFGNFYLILLRDTSFICPSVCCDAAILLPSI